MKGEKKMAVKYQVVGKRHTRTKKGNDYFLYYLTRPFDKYENENSINTLGGAVETVSCFDDFPCKPGDTVELVYSKGFQDKAILSDMRIVKAHIS